MRSQTLLDIRNKLIYDRYSALWAEGLREELIWPKLCAEFHLTETTIYRIILKFTKPNGATIQNIYTQQKLAI
jgi:hypothetical protein